MDGEVRRGMLVAKGKRVMTAGVRSLIVHTRRIRPLTHVKGRLLT